MWWKILIGIFVLGNLAVYALCHAAGKADERSEQLNKRIKGIVQRDRTEKWLE